MDEMTAFDQQIAHEVLREAGPSEPVDGAAIFTAITATQSPMWRGQNMFSVAKYVVAGAIVALFGGFLLAGLLTQPSEPLPPAASSASASPEAVPSDGPTTNDLLPGVDLVTEEVEPGVFRVLRDGVRDLAGVRPKGMSVGQDRSVWLWTETPGLRISLGARGAATLLELGEPGETRFDPPGEFDKGFTAVDADGTFWGAYDPDGDAGRGLASFDGSTWTRHTWPDGADPDFFGIEATIDGAVVVARRVEGGRGPRVARIEDGEWTILPSDVDVPGDALLHLYMGAGPDGTVWLGCSTYHTGSSRWPACAGLLHSDGEAWEVVTPVPGRPELHAGPVAVGPDGTLWAYLNAKADPEDRYLVRLTDGTWSVFGVADGVPMLEGVQTWESNMTVDEDGTLWIGGGQWSISMGVQLPPPLGPSDPPHGVLSFDGTTWRQYLKGLSVERVEALDGTVWAADLDMGDGLGGDGQGGLYVITPEAVAATGE